jgi:asparagine synthase (glutamine-hydrolysing)
VNGLFLVWTRRGGEVPPGSVADALARVSGGDATTRRWSGPGIEIGVVAGAAGVWRPTLAVARDGGREIALAFHGRLDSRPDSESAGAHDMRLQTDADWLLARYRSRGESFLDGVAGSFAVALFDARERLAVLSRDAMGNHYLSCVVTPGLAAAATDDSVLAGLAGTSGDLDPLRLAEYYAGEEHTGSETFFAAVRALLPGEVVIVGEANERRRALPGPPLSERLDLRRPEEVAERFLDALRAAVERSLRAVERVSVLMSGGLDSTSIAALAARALAGGGQAVTALSWRLSDADGDESSWIEAVARRSALDLQWIPCDDALPYSDLARWPTHPATPEQTPYRWFHQRAYARAQHLGHRLVLSGFFGDQLYEGATGWLWSLLASGQAGAAVDRLREAAAQWGWSRVLRSFVVAPVVRRLAPPARRAPHWLAPGARSLLDAVASRRVEMRAARRPGQARNLLTPYNGHGLNVERLYTDRFGLEPAAPLRDPELVRIALAVPDHLLQCGAESRPILRAAIRGLVPEQVRLRRGKGSFLAVFRRGMDGSRLGWAGRLLSEPQALWRGVVSERHVRRWIESGPAGDDEMGCYCRCLDAELWRYAREKRDPAALATGEADSGRSGS